MNKTLFIFLLFFVSIAGAYPANQTAIILAEKYPNADFMKDIIIQSDGNGIYIRYNGSAYPIPNNTEMDNLWNIVQNKRAMALQNATIANRIKQNYTQAMTDLGTIQNGNPPFTQAGFNQVVWAQKRDAEILMDILRFMKWYYWDKT